MAQTHYEALGLKPGCSADDIKAAYRQLVLLHHPDRSNDPNSKKVFQSVVEAYETLGDPIMRRAYDLKLESERDKRRREQEFEVFRKTQAQAGTGTRPGEPPVSAEVAKLAVLFSRGQHGEAEKLARRIIKIDSRQALPYAVLGDLERQKGNRREAAEMYAFAVQMDPRNAVYQQRHEELLKMLDRPMQRKTMPEGTSSKLSPVVGGAVVVVAGSYVALGRENALMPAVSFISSWTLGFMVMALLSGVAVGASLSIGGYLDRFASISSSSAGRVSPSVALAFVATINFWAAGLLYFLGGGFMKSYNYSTSRLVGGVAISTLVLGVCAAISPSVNAPQAAIWGGNLVYLGALAGWVATDSFRT